MKTKKLSEKQKQGIIVAFGLGTFFGMAVLGIHAMKSRQAANRTKNTNEEPTE